MEFVSLLDTQGYRTLIDTSIYLDFGGALAAFGLIFTIYQLRKPQWDIVLRIRDGFQRNLFWILGVLGLLLTLTRVLVTKFPINSLPFPFDTPLTFEILAYLFFIASPLSLFYFSVRAKNIFNENTAEKFYETLIQEISKTDNDRISAALDVLLYNFRYICGTLSDQKSDNETRQIARSILEVVLSDESVVNILTTKRLDALQFIFAIVEKYDISSRECEIGIPKMVQNLFYDKESFFYKHLDRNGLALSSNIYASIFDSPVILNNFDLFGFTTLEYSKRKEIGIAGIKVFIEALSRSIKTYLKTNKVPPRHINNGLEYLSEIFGDLCLKISDKERRGVDTKYRMQDEWSALHLIADFLGHDYPFLAYQEELNQKVTEREKTVLDADFDSDVSINAGIAAALYMSFVQLSYIEDTNDTYHIVLELLNGMMYAGQYKEGYKQPFEKRMWEQIGANLIYRHYPAPLRIYLELMGFCLASDKNQRQGWVGEQAERIRRLLFVDLKPLFDKGTEMVNKKKMKDALLSKSMDYSNGNFIYRFGLGGDEKMIAPAPEGSHSALEGVDLKVRSLL